MQSIFLCIALSYRTVLPEWDKNVLACVVSSKIQSLPLSLSLLFKNMYTADITYDIARAYAISVGDSSNKIYHHRPFHFSFRAFNYSLRRGFFSASRKTREKRTRGVSGRGNMHNANPWKV